MLAALSFAAMIATSAVSDTGRGVVRLDTIRSSSLGVSKHLLVYLPPGYARDASRRYPVAYYLHGAWGAERDWVRLGHLDQTLDSLIARGMAPMIVVMPDGDDGWYTTWNTLNPVSACRAETVRPEPTATYCVPWPKYDEYIARDLVAHVDSAYRTLASPRHRGIAGLSMGGYGAITLALRYPEVFSAAASHSGVLSPRYAGPSPYRSPTRHAPSIDTLRRRYGPALFALMAPAFGGDTAAWRARDPAILAHRLVAAGTRAPALYVDVGLGDAFLEQNRAFRADMESLGIRVRYAEHPGAHTWEYWRAHAGASLRWMAEQIAPGTARARDRSSP